jgi:glycosyltransferase involved in cell wall biosynthesis
MKILLLSDKANWSYHTIAQSLVKHNPRKDIQLSILHIKSDVDLIRKTSGEYDRILVMGWQNYDAVSFLKPHRVFVGIHSHHSWDSKKTTPEHDIDPPASLIKNLSRFPRVNAVSKRLYELFKRNGLSNVWYTPNGVDSQMFVPDSHDSHNPFRIGYSGSKAHDWRKGVSKFIIPSAKAAGVRTSLAMLSTDDYVPLDEMPKFYKSIDCYLCASSSEGFSLSVLEAASCGKPIITTKVGGTDELIQDGVNGFIVPRNVEAMTEKIRMLKDDPQLYRSMSISMRQNVVDRWCWSKRAADWIDFLTK